MRVHLCYNKIVGFNSIKFRDFIRDKYADWRGKGRGSLVDYAKFIGVPQQTMSNWYNGNFKRRPESETYAKLIMRYGVEVYDVLDLPRPSEEDFFEGLPPEVAGPLKAAIEEIRASGMNKDTDIATPEDLERIKAIFEKHGVDIKVISN
jgi:hypothetical protein